MEVVYFIAGVICSSIVNGLIFGFYLKKKNKDHENEIKEAYKEGRHLYDWRGVMW